MKQITYYLYISDTKVDMIFSQIPSQVREKISAELKIDLKLLSVTLGSSSAPLNRYSKTHFVASYLRKAVHVGTIDLPEEYFFGEIPMRWGVLGNRLVYFQGSNLSTIVGLGGSKHHIVGEQRALEIPNEKPWSTSTGGAILNQLCQVTLEERAEADKFNFYKIIEATKLLKGPINKLEFLAKKLFYQYDEKRNQYLLLGSPIYVALKD